jgi:hypothetical protein
VHDRFYSSFSLIFGCNLLNIEEEEETIKNHSAKRKNNQTLFHFNYSLELFFVVLFSLFAICVETENKRFVFVGDNELFASNMSPLSISRFVAL